MMMEIKSKTMTYRNNNDSIATEQMKNSMLRLTFPQRATSQILLRTFFYKIELYNSIPCSSEYMEI